MWPIGGDSWSFSTSDHPDVDFCVWALRRDGLQVPPFDRHSDGDGHLRRAGLTAAAWWAWLTAVVDGVAAADGRRRSEHIERMESHFRETGRPPTSQELRELSARPRVAAPSVLDLCDGSPRLRQTLADLQGAYRAERAERGARELDLVRHTSGTLRDEAAHRSRRLWVEVQQYRPLPPLCFYRVDYPEPTLAVMPPAAAVLGGIHAVVDADPAYESLVLRAAAQLAGR